jgi:hypothetical protein
MGAKIRTPRLINAEPAMRTCLGCDKPFKSPAKDVRFCDRCRYFIQRDMPPVSGQRHYYLRHEED